MDSVLTDAELEAAIAWFSRSVPMPGARRMYGIALSALRALKVDNDQLDGMDRDGLIAVIHYLRAGRDIRDRMLEQTEAEIYELRCRLEGKDGQKV